MLSMLSFPSQSAPAGLGPLAGTAVLMPRNYAVLCTGAGEGPAGASSPGGLTRICIYGECSSCISGLQLLV